MPGTIVPYDRFLEIRQRRERVKVALAPPSLSPRYRESGGGQHAPIIDCKAGSTDLSPSSTHGHRPGGIS